MALGALCPLGQEREGGVAAAQGASDRWGGPGPAVPVGRVPCPEGIGGPRPSAAPGWAEQAPSVGVWPSMTGWWTRAAAGSVGTSE